MAITRCEVCEKEFDETTQTEKCPDERGFQIVCPACQANIEKLAKAVDSWGNGVIIFNPVS